MITIAPLLQRQTVHKGQPVGVGQAEVNEADIGGVGGQSRLKRAGAAKCAYGPIIAIFATSIVVSMIAQCAHFICATRYGELYNDKLMQYVECLFRILLCAPYFIKVYYNVTDKTTVYQQNYLAKLFYALIINSSNQSLLYVCIHICQI